MDVAPRDRRPVLFAGTEFNEVQGQFSPDGRYIAYTSDESGRSEIYVKPFPSGGKSMVSQDGGTQPRWQRDGRELFYFAGRTLMSVDISLKPQFRAGVPKTLFEAPIFLGGYLANVMQRCDVAPDGKRFLINATMPDTTAAPINVVMNWTAGLKK